ncbi:MAG: hypothetical protein RLZZ242_324 [Bacteroidota bacterium]
MISYDIAPLEHALKSGESAVIIPHKNPDGDALGACLALYHFLTSRGKTCTVIAPNGFPDFLNWMPGSSEILIAENAQEQAHHLIQETELIFTLDFNDLSRCGVLENSVASATAFKVMIDHHIDPKDYAQLTYSDTNMSSTCELVYHLITAMDGTSVLSSEISSCLYTGILTDTGSFKYPTATATTLRVVAELVDHGADKSRIAQELFDQGHLSRFKLMGRCIEHLEVFETYATALMYLTEKDKQDCQFKKGDTEGFVNMGLQLKGIHFSAIFIEHAEDRMIKISFRSIGAFDVNAFARAHFDGGGHKNAAGGRSDLSLEETLVKFKSLLPHYLTSLKSSHS